MKEDDTTCKNKFNARRQNSLTKLWLLKLYVSMFSRQKPTVNLYVVGTLFIISAFNLIFI